MLKKLLVAATLAVAFTAPAMAFDSELVMPAPIYVPAGLTEGKVVKEIKRSLLGRTWQIESEKPGEIIGLLLIREHTARIRIKYDTKQVTTEYVDSTNLEYSKDKKGKEYIHGAFLNWMKFLTTDINTNLQMAALPE